LHTRSMVDNQTCNYPRILLQHEIVSRQSALTSIHLIPVDYPPQTFPFPSQGLRFFCEGPSIFEAQASDSRYCYVAHQRKLHLPSNMLSTTSRRKYSFPFHQTTNTVASLEHSLLVKRIKLSV